MVKGDLIHPELIAALSKCGHGDGNYPLATKTGDAEKIYLGLTPGLPDVPAVLRAIQSAIVIEQAEVMMPEDGSTPEIYEDFQRLLGGLELKRLGRFPFYEACQEPGVRVAVSTGEQRLFGNLLLTVGPRGRDD